MLLAAALQPRADVTWSPLDERWYHPLGGSPSDTGIPIGPETIYRCGVILAAVRFLAYAWAMCPPSVGRRLPNGGRAAEPGHYAQRVLRNPNAWQTGFRWRELNMLRACTWGNSCNRIVPGPASFADELWPLHPARIRVIDQASSGELIYEHQPPNGAKPERLMQHEVLHFRGLSSDGFSGMALYQLIRNAVGIALAAEKHAAVFLRKGTRLSGLLSKDGPLTPVVKTAVRESWAALNAGMDNSGNVAVVGDGFKFTPMGTDHQKAQFLELRDFQVGDALRFMGVPGVVVGYADKTATYASAKEFFESGGIKHCVLPWVTNFEQEVEKALLLEDGSDRFIKYNLDVLLRASTKERIETLVKATGRPIMTGNEARAIEDLNPDDDPSMDKVLLPTNMATSEPEPEPEPEPAPPAPPAPPPPAPAPAKPKPPEEEEARRMARAHAIALRAAARVVGRELVALRGDDHRLGAARKYSKDAARFAEWVADFYESHSTVVAETLELTPEQAADYCQAHRDALLERGVAAAETWEAEAPRRLAALALGMEA
jgi:HK97 family phage portal protein